MLNPRVCLPLLLALLIHLGDAFAIDNDPPNIVLLLADDLGWTGLGCFGSDFYETPHLDALADRGIRFTNAYSACTVCSPTRASIMTGKAPARLHLTDFIAGQHRPWAKMTVPDWTKRLRGDETTIAEVLKSAGYRTGHINKWHLSGRGEEAAGTEPTDQGFDFSYQRPQGTQGYRLKSGITSQSGSSYLTDLLTDKACEFIDRSESQPFFLYFAYSVPHTPIQGRPDLVDHFTKKLDAQTPSQTENIHDNPVYAAMVASLDQSVGRIVATLDQKGLTDNTVIIFFSDNGGLTERYGQHDGFTENLPLRRGKGSAYEGGVRVPAIVSWPDVTTAGTVCEEPIITTDLFPTLRQIAGITAEPSETIDGESLVRLLKDPSIKLDRDLFWHYPHYHAGGDGPYSAIRSGKYRLIESLEDGHIELYDLAKDIGEQNDLSTALPSTVTRLRAKLDQWRTSVDAQMPQPNPKYDPDRASNVNSKRRRGPQ